MLLILILKILNMYHKNTDKLIFKIENGLSTLRRVIINIKYSHFSIFTPQESWKTTFNFNNRMAYMYIIYRVNHIIIEIKNIITLCCNKTFFFRQSIKKLKLK